MKSLWSWFSRSVSRITSNTAIALLTFVNILFFYKPFASANIEIRCDSQLYVQQELGNLSFYQFMTFKNIGDKQGYITKIEGFIRSKDRDVEIFRKKVSGQYYYNNTEGNNPLLELSLSPNQLFSGSIQLYKEPDRVTKDSSAIIQAMMIDLAQQNERKLQYGNLKAADASKNISTLIDNFIAIRENELKAGEYEYILQITKNNEQSPFFIKCYSFFIYPDNIFLIKESVKDFKRYYVLNLNYNRRPETQIPITEIENPEIIASLKSELFR